MLQGGSSYAPRIPLRSLLFSLCYSLLVRVPWVRKANRERRAFKDSKGHKAIKETSALRGPRVLRANRAFVARPAPQARLGQEGLKVYRDLAVPKVSEAQPGMELPFQTLQISWLNIVMRWSPFSVPETL